MLICIQFFITRTEPGQDVPRSSAIISTSIASDFGTLGILEVFTSGRVRSTTMRKARLQNTVLGSGNGAALAYRLAAYEPEQEQLTSTALRHKLIE